MPFDGWTGLLYDHGHLSRAVCCRLAHGELNIEDSLPPGFHVNHPLLGRVTTYNPPRETQKTKELSMNWVIGDQHVELTDGTKGICISTYVSPFCCRHLHVCYSHIYVVVVVYSLSSLLSS